MLDPEQILDTAMYVCVIASAVSLLRPRACNVSYIVAHTPGNMSPRMLAPWSRLARSLGVIRVLSSPYECQERIVNADKAEQEQKELVVLAKTPHEGCPYQNGL